MDHAYSDTGVFNYSNASNNNTSDNKIAFNNTEEEGEQHLGLGIRQLSYVYGTFTDCYSSRIAQDFAAPVVGLGPFSWFHLTAL